KRISGDGSVGFPHVRVAHCQVPFEERAILTDSPFLCVIESEISRYAVEKTERTEEPPRVLIPKKNHDSAPRYCISNRTQK
uniref:hypothetical protein n=1 Tax=Alteromonas lipotrueae TaxID=2803814 RepID=UPI001C486CAE